MHTFFWAPVVLYDIAALVFRIYGPSRFLGTCKERLENLPTKYLLLTHAPVLPVLLLLGLFFAILFYCRIRSLNHDMAGAATTGSTTDSISRPSGMTAVLDSYAVSSAGQDIESPHPRTQTAEGLTRSTELTAMTANRNGGHEDIEKRRRKFHLQQALFYSLGFVNTIAPLLLAFFGRHPL